MASELLTPPAVGEGFDRDAFDRAWRRVPGDDLPAPASISKTELTIVRESPTDFRDRQVYIWVDGEDWGKVKYGQPLTRDIAPGRHSIRANNTLFNAHLDITAAPGERVRVRCTNGLPRAGLLVFIFFHATYLRVSLEQERG